MRKESKACAHVNLQKKIKNHNACSVSLLLYNNDETTHYGKLKEKNVSDAGDIVWEVNMKKILIHPIIIIFTWK
jgi:hypothetical protein